jgi:hypothetical protein
MTILTAERQLLAIAALNRDPITSFIPQRFSLRVESQLAKNYSEPLERR